jgi:dihydropteroate synthase
METKIFGILNITPDSFSDGGENFNYENAIKTAKNMIKNNIFAIDVGAESTRPNAIPISSQEEIARLDKIIPTLINLKANISLDTRNYETAKWGLENGVKIINDVSGLQDERTIKLISNHKAKVCFMHSLTIPANPQIIMQKKDVLKTLLNFAKNKIDQCNNLGIKKENLIFDIGIGFGKNAEQSVFLIKNIEYFKSLGVKLLVGHSRKSFLKLPFKHIFDNKIPSIEELDLMTQVFSAFMEGKVNFLRLHAFDKKIW